MMSALPALAVGSHIVLCSPGAAASTSAVFPASLGGGGGVDTIRGVEGGGTGIAGRGLGPIKGASPLLLNPAALWSHLGSFNTA